MYDISRLSHVAVIVAEVSAHAFEVVPADIALECGFDADFCYRRREATGLFADGSI